MASIFKPKVALMMAIPLVLIIALQFYFQYKMELQAKISTGRDIYSLLKTTEQALISWSKMVKTDVFLAANDTSVRQQTLQLIKADKDKEQQQFLTAQNNLKELFSNAIAHREYVGFSIISPQMKILSSNYNKKNHWTIDLEKKVNLLSLTFKGQPQFHFPPYKYNGLINQNDQVTKNTTLLVSSPIYDDDNNIVAAMVLTYDPSSTLMPLLKQAQTGTSGETYLINKSGEMLNPSRFISSKFDKGASSNNNYALIASQLNANNLGQQLEAYLDYRGIEVIGSWLWLSELEFGLVTEIDLSEAISSSEDGVNFIRLFSAVFICLLIYIYSLIAVYGNRLINHKRKVNALNDKLKDSNVNLEDKVVERTKAAKVAVIAKGDFLAKMSHEIRTPFNGILGMIEALGFTQTSEEQKDLLATLNSSSKHLLRLFNDLLDFSQLDKQQLTLKETPTQLHDIFDDIVKEYQQQITDKNIFFSTYYDKSIAPYVLADSSRLTQAIGNLMTNAVKFTSQGKITFTIKALINQHNEISNDSHTSTKNNVQNNVQKIEIRVSDTGLGISKEKKAGLFQPFIQAENNSTRSYDGSGLGLSICYELVNLMSGKISVQSELGLGSTFVMTLTLPLTKPTSTVFSDPLKSSELKEKKLTSLNGLALKVLVAEDHPVNQKVIVGQLKQLGITADVASDGLIAYEKCQQKSYDIVLSDCHMPNMDGFEFVTKIMNSNMKEKPLIIAITADSVSGIKEKCLEVGFVNYLRKPFTINQLEQKIVEAFE
ncbi:hybrid sensor histidine kinase/response regulator [Colwellia piezophila]|uniref:hybrid sensor histidine kinase/response regulator n=1 Tax=Colwellia piezophila TaxID=211668 RepID=UPI000373AD9F|nr:hybrid sensor histidine kinase/response regulator [Colwellia piezophila]